MMYIWSTVQVCDKMACCSQYISFLLLALLRVLQWYIRMLCKYAQWYCGLAMRDRSCGIRDGII